MKEKLNFFCEREALARWERNGRTGLIAEFSSGHSEKDQSQAPKTNQANHNDMVINACLGKEG